MLPQIIGSKTYIFRQGLRLKDARKKFLIREKNRKNESESEREREGLSKQPSTAPKIH